MMRCPATALVVTQNADGRFECAERGAVGAVPCGRGASVLEAVGSWAIYSGAVDVRCEPPAVVREFTVATPYGELEYRPAPRRE